MGSDESIANSAWTSTYDRNRRESNYDDREKVEALVRRMTKDGHSTPFESVVLRFWIRMPIFVDRQHMTHRIASHNGLSGRYRTLPKDWFKIPADVLAIFNKINHGYGNHINDKYEDLMNAEMRFYEAVLEECKKAERAVVITNAEYKRVREITRGVIGTASMVERTTIFNLRSFANYQRLRNSDHAQAEIHQLADMMLQQVEASDVCPIAISALKENGWRV